MSNLKKLFKVNKRYFISLLRKEFVENQTTLVAE